MENVLAQCSVAFTASQPYVVALFLGGVTGGFTHCIPMCGAFSACRNACGGTACSSRTATWERCLNLSHHLGRMTSYGMLGLAAALLAKQVAAYAFWPKLEAGLLLVAGLMFLGSSVTGFLQRWHIAHPVSHSYLRGLLLGFLPCGLIYAALMVVAASANPWIGFFGMAAFVLGTLPALWLTGLSVELLSQRWRGEMQRAGRVAMALNGVVLLIVAGKLVI